MVSYQERERNIGLWIDEFGSRRRNSITTQEIAVVLQRWEREGYAASTLNHRRGALMHVWSRLDGKNVDNPVVRIPRYKEPEPEPRGLSWEEVDRIFAAMPDKGQPVAGRTLDDASKTKARLAAIAFTGLTQAQLKRLRPQDILWRVRHPGTSTTQRQRGISPGAAGGSTWTGGTRQVRGTRLLGHVLEPVTEQKISTGMREDRDRR